MYGDIEEVRKNFARFRVQAEDAPTKAQPSAYTQAAIDSLAGIPADYFGFTGPASMTALGFCAKSGTPKTEKAALYAAQTENTARYTVSFCTPDGSKAAQFTKPKSNGPAIG